MGPCSYVARVPGSPGAGGPWRRGAMQLCGQGVGKSRIRRAVEAWGHAAMWPRCREVPEPEGRGGVGPCSYVARVSGSPGAGGPWRRGAMQLCGQGVGKSRIRRAVEAWGHVTMWPGCREVPDPEGRGGVGPCNYVARVSGSPGSGGPWRRGPCSYVVRVSGSPGSGGPWRRGAM